MVYIVLLWLCLLPAFSWTFNISGRDCIDGTECPSTSELQDTYGTRVLLNLISCSTNIRDFKVYCIDEAEVSSFTKKADLLNDEECGKEFTVDKISQGNTTNPEDYPWIALLQYVKGDIKSYACHANVISKKYLLTAAHCLHPNTTEKYGNVTHVILGAHNIKTDIDCENCTKVQKILIESFYYHPDFPKDMDNDIGLIHLQDDIVYSEWVRPICMVPVNFISPYDERLLVAGWGNNELGVMNSAKLQAIFRLNKNCSEKYNQKKQYCVESFDSDAQTCLGDSGGPLMVPRKNDITRQHLIGVCARGVRCYQSNDKISFYTKVTYYIKWIIDTM